MMGKHSMSENTPGANHSVEEKPQFSASDLRGKNAAFEWLHAPIPEGVSLVITHKLRKAEGMSPKEIVSEIDYSGVIPQQLLKSGAHPHILVEFARSDKGRKNLDNIPSRASGKRNKIVVKDLLSPRDDEKKAKTVASATGVLAKALATASPEEKAALMKELGL